MSLYILFSGCWLMCLVCNIVNITPNSYGLIEEYILHGSIAIVFCTATVFKTPQLAGRHLCL
ncbi:hypothetical protein V1527DRAFT_463011 [Lipomyces starkeyi]